MYAAATIIAVVKDQQGNLIQQLTVFLGQAVGSFFVAATSTPTWPVGR
jgi:hypothetical protein